MHISKSADQRTSFFKYQMRVTLLLESLRQVQTDKRADPERRRGSF